MSAEWSHGATRTSALLLGLASAAVVAVAVTLGLFGGSGALGSQTMTGGSVTMTRGTASTCTVSAMFPGSAPPACTLTASYTGADPAYLGLDILIVTQAGNGGTALYNPSDPSHALQVTIASTSPATTFTLPTTGTPCPSGSPGSSTCYGLDRELVSTSSFSSGQVTFSTTVGLPSTTTTGYRGGAAQITLTVHAAQAAHNPATGCTPGAVCAGLHWS